MNDITNRKELLMKIWGDDSFYNSRNLDVYISKIRKYFKEDPTVELKTLKGVGYQFIITEWSGIHTFSKALRHQDENSNLKVFEIIPPLVDTDMTRGRGTGKLTPAQLAEEFISAYQKDKFEINIGKTKLLSLVLYCFSAFWKGDKPRIKHRLQQQEG